MSSNLYWEPAPEARKRQGLSTAIKFALRRVYGEPLHVEMGSDDDILLLRGMIAAGGDEIITDATALLAAIEKYGTIVLDEVY